MERLELLNLVTILEDEGYEAKIYEGYSGRGMYGKEVDGISSDCPRNEFQNIAGQNGFGSFRVDNLGKGFIYY